MSCSLFLFQSLVEGGGRLKGVFYRAIQQCPWAKVYTYMPGKVSPYYKAKI